MARFDKILNLIKKAGSQVDDAAAKKLAREEAEVAADILSDPGMARLHNEITGGGVPNVPNFTLVDDVSSKAGLPVVPGEKALVPRSVPEKGIVPLQADKGLVQQLEPEKGLVPYKPRAMEAASDIIDVTPTQVTDKASFLKKYGIPGAAIGGAGLLGISALTGDKQPATVPPQEAVPVVGEEVVAAPTPEVPAPVATTPQPVSSSSVTQETVTKSGPSPVEDILKSIDFGKEHRDTAANLQAQQDERNRIARLVAMTKAGNALGSAIAGVKVSGNEIHDDLLKQADKEVEQYKERMEKDKNDPNSPISKGMRDMAKNLLGVEIKGDASAEVLMKVMPQLQSYYQSVENRELRREEQQQRALDRGLQREAIAANRELARATKDEERAYKREQADMAKSVRVIEKFNADPQVKKLNESIARASNVRELLQQARTNPAAWQVVGTQAARALGEVGNLTEQDIARFKGSKAWLSQFRRWVSEGKSGTPPVGDIKDMEAMIDVFESRNKQNLNNEAKRFSKQYGKAYDMDSETLMAAVVPDYIPGTQEKSQVAGDKAASSKLVKVQAPNGSIKMIPESQVDAAVKAGGIRIN